MFPHKETPSFHLYTYFRSSCSARLRIALALKQLPYAQTAVNLLKDDHKQCSYLELNPSQSVPTLVISSTYNGETKNFSITQSIAALEYLEEAFHDTYSILPPRDLVEARSIVRTLCSIIATDTQPVTNMRILKRVKTMAAAAGKDEVEAANTWAKGLIADGLAAYESVCRNVAGKYSFGDNMTMADCCLVPAVWGAQRYGVNLEDTPTVLRVFETLSLEDCVKVSHWSSQEDTPEELRH